MDVRYERAAEFIVTSLRTQPHKERRGAACRLWIRYLETDESKLKGTGRGRRRTFRAERPSKEQTRLFPQAFASGWLYSSYFFLPRMLFDFQEYREHYSECTQKYEFLSINKFVGCTLNARNTRWYSPKFLFSLENGEPTHEYYS